MYRSHYIFIATCSNIEVVQYFAKPQFFIAGITVIQSKDLSNELDTEERLNSMKHANLMMKKAKVFVACISDQYTQNQTCRMEFQFAKSTLKKPVVPIVFGEGREWQLSVVGKLYGNGIP